MASQSQSPGPVPPGLPELLAADAALAVAQGEPGSVRLLDALRAQLPRAVAALAADLARARARARMRHPLAERGFYTTRGLEQCTPAPVARLRARRLAARARGVVLDATCGVGGDALALATTGVRVVAMDRDPLLAACARANLDRAGLQALVVVGDALHPPVRADLLVLDPDRRPDGRREVDPAAWSPGLEQALALARTVRGACLKLAPAIDAETLERLVGRGLCQWISLDGELREVCLWTGALAGSDAGLARQALALRSDGSAASLEGPARTVAALDEERARAVAFLADPDPAVIRSGLLGNLAERTGLAPLAAELAYLGGDTPPRSALLRGFRVLGCCACDARSVRRLLAAHDVGAVEVRKRGHPEPAEALARRFRGRGRRRGRLAVARLARGHAAYLIEPLEAPAEGPVGVGDEGFEPPASSL